MEAPVVALQGIEVAVLDRQRQLALVLAVELAPSGVAPHAEPGWPPGSRPPLRRPRSTKVLNRPGFSGSSLL